MPKKKISYTKEMIHQITIQDVLINDVPGHQFRQYARMTLIKFSDPDFGSAETLEYGQSDSIKGKGSHRGYSIVFKKNILG